MFILNVSVLKAYNSFRINRGIIPWSCVQGLLSTQRRDTPLSSSLYIFSTSKTMSNAAMHHVKNVGNDEHQFFYFQMRFNPWFQQAQFNVVVASLQFPRKMDNDYVLTTTVPILSYFTPILILLILKSGFVDHVKSFLMRRWVIAGWHKHQFPLCPAP